MTTITALVHTRNEEANLEDCLACLRWCDEILVVDMESEDRTVEIARQFTDRIASVPKMGMADPARRLGVEIATGDWILIVDADELVPSSLALELKAVSERSDIDIVRIPFQNYLLGAWIRHTAWWPQFHPRFFRKGTVIPNARVHELYQMRSDRILTLAPVPELCLQHFNYLDSSQFIAKMNNYTDREVDGMIEVDRRDFSAVRLFVRPVMEFALRYVYKRGFLDGWRGLLLSVYMAFYRFLAEAKLWEARHNAHPALEYARLKNSIRASHEAGDTRDPENRGERAP
jgi:glycosyltransferase involved in cell wall biosynthesis